MSAATSPPGCAAATTTPCPDLVQDTFTAALEELAAAHDDVEGWFLQLAAKMCTRHAWTQRRYLRAALTLGEHQRAAAHNDPLPAPGRAPGAQIAQALARLDPAERLTLQLRFLDGQRHETAARIMGCSPWTSKQRQRRGLQQLAAWLQADLGTPTASTRRATPNCPRCRRWTAAPTDSRW